MRVFIFFKYCLKLLLLEISRVIVYKYKFNTNFYKQFFLIKMIALLFETVTTVFDQMQISMTTYIILLSKYMYDINSINPSPSDLPAVWSSAWLFDFHILFLYRSRERVGINAALNKSIVVEWYLNMSYVVENTINS